MGRRSRANQRNRSKARARARSSSIVADVAARSGTSTTGPAPKPARRVVAKYDAAQTTGENRRHWANADDLAPNAAVSEAVRRVIRARSRYEVANNSYAKGMVETLANDAVGTGPRVQVSFSESEDDNQRVEDLFTAWASEIDIAGKLRMMRRARAETGEVFGVMMTNTRLYSQVKLDMVLIEADQVGTPFFGFNDNIFDGIEVDSLGHPVSYFITKSHPGDTTALAVSSLDYDRVPAASVIHYFRPERPGQLRGVPDITPALPLFAQLRRYTLATIAAAETAADFAAVLYSDAPADGGADPADPFDTVDLEQRMATILPNGWKLGQVKAEQPTTTYGEFKHEILNEIARCLNMPFNVAAGNSSTYNYASGRLDHQVYFKAISVDRRDMEIRVLRRVFAAWLNEAVLIDGYLPQSYRRRDVLAREPVWYWPGFEHVDPAKDASAQATRLASFTTTLKDEWAKVGKDWLPQLRQIALEQQTVRELGITKEQAIPQAQPAAVREEDEEEADAR